MVELEQEIADWRANESAIAESLIVASRTAREIVESAAAQAGQLEQEATARVNKLEQETLVRRTHLVTTLRQAAWNLNDLIGTLSTEVQRPAETLETLPSTDSNGANAQLTELRIDRQAS